MAGKIGVTMEGIPELKRGSETLFRRIGEEAPSEFENVAKSVASSVSIPRDTGKLAASVETKTLKSSAIVRYGSGVRDEWGSRYARFVEYGGRGHPAGRPGNYLIPEGLAAEPQVKEAAEDVARSEIRKMRWPSP